MTETRTCSRCGTDFEVVRHPIALCGWCECDDRNRERRANQKAQPGSLQPAGYAAHRVIPESVSRGGYVFYAVQCRKWRGWKTLENGLTKENAERAIKELNTQWWHNDQAHPTAAEREVERKKDNRI